MSNLLMRDLAVVLEDVVVHCARCDGNFLRDGLYENTSSQSVSQSVSQELWGQTFMSENGQVEGRT